MSQYVTIKKGNLLDATEKYVIHQCNCVSKYAKTLAKQIFDKYPYANTYINRQYRNIPGTIDICGDHNHRYIINFYSQLYPSIPKYNNDSYELRLKWFKECLNLVSQIDNLENIAMPYLIGCGSAGGDWNDYIKIINDFAEKIKKPIVLYKL